jgi:hypothetical protein
MMTAGSLMYETRTIGEPDWLPPAEEVMRARARMERLGILQALHGSDAPPVGVGDTPWLWWAGAGLWLLVWPAATAATVSGRLLFFPWWFLVVLPLVHMLMLTWPLLSAYLDDRRAPVARRFRRVRTLTEVLALDPDEFEVWTSLLFQLMGYQVRNTPDVADHGIDLEVFDGEQRLGLVQCKRYRGTVGEPTVRDLYGTMMDSHAMCGWLVTTGAFSRQARDWALGKPIELWDGRQLIALAQKYA